MEQKIQPLKNGLRGMVTIPGDKSISHRAVMFGSIAKGTTEITGFLKGEDCLSTVRCMKQLGVSIVEDGDKIIIESSGLKGLKEPDAVLDVGNSGTTIRLLAGILATSPFSSILVGDDSIAKRPMGRVTGPLKMLNATVDGREHGQYTPLFIRGGDLRGVHYVSPIASAQVKSSILLAGLGARGTTTVTEPYRSRDHTERMLQSFGVEVNVDDRSVSIEGGQTLTGTMVKVPGDISSAAFLLVAGAITEDSEVVLKDVGINPTRTGILDVLKEMGGDLTISDETLFGEEPVATLHIKTSKLVGTTIGGELIPRLIDEIPAIAILATQAHGTTIIKDAEELKVKETNRIDTMVSQLKELGANIEATPDGMRIIGPTPLHGGTVDSFGDHRIGMSMALCGLISADSITVKNTDAIAVSYPNFFEHLNLLSEK
ncbi:3-phosphoshikimate 1-carboxyvinyltransferase [Evansella tamaricis]|uniref:3-phosphoshikimate 1-carboxyvinyltransferase n=1 Tax=Evansella tamaricis TaxID=2069301 RepID=A0ABS6JE81_9BACI|nr:3-phosphoshikimate 1-carboxyvinyltransferase [Evansella tamaricis]MBU9711813.1 3-phosphoshikimate 1-carboxyvinyltransferase [Evansella tamaricis]